jgi:excisionase family DNA binding protein
MREQRTMPALLTCREFAEALRVEDSTAYRWARSGVVASVRVGSTVRIPVAELERIAGEQIDHREEATP